MDISSKMQTYVPTTTHRRRTEPPEVGALHVSHNNLCQICFSEKRDLRQLPCQHQFCKRCLKNHLDTISSLDTWLHCPVCKSPVNIPKGASKEKLMQLFTKSENKSVFYDTESDAILRTVSHTDTNVIKRPSRGGAKHILSTRRTALRITGSLLEHIHGFQIRGPEDEATPMCWGVDCFPNGDIVLADWINSCVKLYNKDGIFLSNLKIDHRPLGICALDHGYILVSLGSRHKLLYLLKVKNGDLRGDRIYPLKGYLYDLARYRDKCLGIFETDKDSKLELLKVSRDGETHLKYIDKPDSPIQSHSGIVVKPRSTHRTFYTSGEKLNALDTNGSTLYSRSYTFTEAGVTKNYQLGAICLDAKDGLFIASDYCVLHVDRNGDLINVLPTKIDPYAITVQSDGVTLVIVGRNKIAETYRIEYGIQS